jgi:hypothetical protein
MADGGGSKTKTVSTSSATAPWAPTQPGLEQGIKDWTDLYKSGGLQVPYYPGQTVAGVAPESSQAWQQISDLAGNPNSSNVKAATDYDKAILSGDYSALSPMFDAARSQADSRYEASGRFGGGYHDAAVGKGVGAVIADAAGGAASRAPGLQQAMYQPSQFLDTVGQERQGQAQNEIQAAIDKFNYDQTSKSTAIQNYMAGLPGGSGASVTGTQPLQVNQSNPWLQYAGLAASALGSAAGSFF